jgi:hypothetical protein
VSGLLLPPPIGLLQPLAVPAKQLRNDLRKECKC